MLWWYVADLVAALHLAFMGGLFLGAWLALRGWLRRRPRLAAPYYLVLLVSTFSQFVMPWCTFTYFETVLRQQGVPGWERGSSLLAALVAALTGWRPPELLFGALGATMVTMALWAFLRDYGLPWVGQLLDRRHVMSQH
jgi:hypothetical protein